MKLLRLIRSLHPAGGGPAAAIQQITPHLTALGVSTMVASLDPPGSPWLDDQPFTAVGLGPVAGGYGYRRGLAARIRSLSLQHDSVIIHGIWQYHAFAAWRALHASPIPYWVYPHGMLDPWFRKTYPLKHLKKWAYWPWADYRVLRDAKAVLFTTELERDLARQSFWLYDVNECVVGYGSSSPCGNKIEQRRLFFHFFPHLRHLRIFLFLGRIHPKKGIDLLIDAFAEVCGQDPLLHLVIAGPDQIGWKQQLLRRIADHGISERVTWTGMLSGDIKWGAFHAAELFCLPSHQENFGMSVAESLSCGCPVAVSEPVNISAEVLAAGAGFVHRDTEEATADALRQWLALPEADKLAMRVNAETLFREYFDVKSVARKLLLLLQR